MNENGKAINFECEHCGNVLFVRRGNTIVAHGFEIELSLSRNIKCECGYEGTRFCIDRNGRNKVQVRVEN